MAFLNGNNEIFNFKPIDIKLVNNKIIIEGLKANTYQLLSESIVYTWKTSKLSSHLLKGNIYTGLRIDEFFIFELYYILDNIKFNKYTRNYILGRPLVEKLKHLLVENTWLKDVLNSTEITYNESRLNLLNGKPLPHSSEFFKIYFNNTAKYRLNGYILGSPPGTGKTYMNIALGVLLGVSKHICVVPKNSVHLVWEEEIIKWNKKEKKIWIYDGDKPFNSNYDYYIVSYENVTSLLNQIESIANKFQNSMVTLDESHNFNELTAVRTLDFINLVKVLNTKHVIWSSGTPIKAIGKEIIPMLRTIDPLFTHSAEETFKKIFGGNRTEALNILAERMGFILFSVDKKTVVDNERLDEDILVKVPNSEKYTLPEVKKQMAAYILERTNYFKPLIPSLEKRYFQLLDIYEKSIIKDVKELNAFNTYLKYVKIVKSTNINELSLIKEELVYCNLYEKKIMHSLGKEEGLEFKDLKTVYKYLILKIRGEVLGRILTRLRIDCVMDMIPYIGLDDYIKVSEKKTIIFTDYVEAVDEANQYLTNIGYKPLLVYGKTNNELETIVDKFLNDKTANPLIATYKSLSSAVRLTIANSVILLNVPFRSYILNQAISRVDRKGQDSVVRVYTCILDTDKETNINSRNLDIMKWYEEQVSAILGIKTDFKEPEFTMESINIKDYTFDVTSKYIGLINKLIKIKEELVKQPNIENINEDNKLSYLSFFNRIATSNSANPVTNLSNLRDAVNDLNKVLLGVIEGYDVLNLIQHTKLLPENLSESKFDNLLPGNFKIDKTDGYMLELTLINLGDNLQKVTDAHCVKENMNSLKTIVIYTIDKLIELIEILKSHPNIDRFTYEELKEHARCQFILIDKFIQDLLVYSEELFSDFKTVYLNEEIY